MKKGARSCRRGPVSRWSTTSPGCTHMAYGPPCRRTRRMASIKRKGDVIRVRFEPEERMIIGGFAREVSQLLGGVAAADPDPLVAMVGMGSETSTAPPEDPALRRLLPDAYDDPAGAAEFRRLTDDEVRRGKTSAVKRLADGADGSDGALGIDDEIAHVLEQELDDVRVVLGAGR